MARLGILGDGQLGCLLAMAAQELGHSVQVFGSETERLKTWGLAASSDLRELEKDSDILIIESEFFDFSKVIASEKLFPSLKAIQLLSNKFSQKKLFQKLSLPSAAFRSWSQVSSFEELSSLFPKAFVLKTAFGGYDGKGVFAGDASSKEGVDRFMAAAERSGSEVYAEERIDFELELALVSVRSNKEILHYPLVVSEQKNGICDFVKGPAEFFGLSKEIEKQARDCAREIAEETNLFGAFALEFFWSSSRGLMINELAPRVHNSGHFSLLQAEASQFSNHIRATLGEKLVPYTRSEIFAMKNWIGRKSAQVSLSGQRWPDEVEICDYHKRESKPGRKMGHFCFTAESPQSLVRRRESLEKKIDQYWETIN